MQIEVVESPLGLCTTVYVRNNFSELIIKINNEFKRNSELETLLQMQKELEIILTKMAEENIKEYRVKAKDILPQLRRET